MSPPTQCGIGSLPFPFPLFPHLDTLFTDLVTDTFKQLSTWERVQSFFRLLLEQIEKTLEPTFLLPAVVAYLERVNNLRVIDLPVSFALFEFWLNHFSKVSFEAQARIRGKIAGKYLPREEYGCLFPISLGKVHSGSHFISAHLSPDLDTTVASFIGWLDAFAARLCTGQHLWNLPGGPSQEQIAVLFTKWFGPSIFSILSHTEGAMRLSAMDLLTTDSILYAESASTLTHLDHNMGNTAILYVDAAGYYQGDWRGSNFEPVQQITTLFDRVLRKFAHAIHVDLLALFAQEELIERNLPHFYAKSLAQSLESVLENVEIDSPYQKRLDLFCKKVLLLEKGLSSSFQELFSRFSMIGIPQVSAFLKEIQELDISPLLGRALFRPLYRLVHSLDEAVDGISCYVDRLDVIMCIKHDVLGYQPSCAALRADLETLRLSIGERDYLTIVLVDEEGRRTPLGVVLATTLRKTILGTVSQRDFSNSDEMHMAPYLTVISVIDHHKSTLETRTPIQALLADVQSCNVLVAEQSFLLNDRYGSGGVTLEQLNKQLKSCMQACSNVKSSLNERRLLERLLRKHTAMEENKEFYIHPLREYLEYFYCLHAILDDTDLLSKVGVRDVQCVASLLHRLKTLCSGIETEAISLEDLPKTPEGAKRAAQRLLDSPDLHDLYITLYAQRQQEVEHALNACVLDGDLALFSDTKQQNGCCRIGQIKLFQGNQLNYTKDAHVLLKRWLDESERVVIQDPQCDLHLMMVSTLDSPAKRHDKSKVTSQDPNRVEDSLWIWAAPTTRGLDHLTRFLSAFQHLPGFQQQPLRVTLCGAKNREWQELFTQNFRVARSIQLENKEEERTYALVHYPCGLINSRKTMISPFLPSLVGSSLPH